MNLFLNQEHQNSIISLSSNCYHLPAKKTSCCLSRIILKSNFKHVPRDGVVRALNKCEIHNFLLTGEVIGKNVTGIEKVLKKINNF